MNLYLFSLRGFGLWYLQKSQNHLSYQSSCLRGEGFGTSTHETTLWFWPTRNVHWTVWPLWQFTNVTFRPHVALLLRHPPSHLIRPGNLCQPPKSWTFCHCFRMSTFFTWIVTGCFFTCHQGTPGSVLACLVVMKCHMVKIRAWWWDSLMHGSVGGCALT